MSSSVSTRYEVAREADRLRDAALRATLEAQLVRSAELRRSAAQVVSLHTRYGQCLATGDLAATLSALDEALSESQATRERGGESAVELDALVKDVGGRLDDAEDLLAGHPKLRLQERLGDGGRHQQAAASSPLPPAGAAPARPDTGPVAQLAAAAIELLLREGGRCAEADLPDLTRRCDAIGHQPVGTARLALRDLQIRVTESVRRRRDAGRAAELRASLGALLEETGAEDRTVLRRDLASTVDDQLEMFERRVRSALERESRRRARTAVAGTLVASLEALGYQVGEPFEDLLATPGEPLLLRSPHHRDYGVRVRFEQGRPRFHLSVVHRDDAGPGPDLEIQRKTCADLDAVLPPLSESGCGFASTFTEPNGEAPTWEASRWPAREAGDGEAADGEEGSEAAIRRQDLAAMRRTRDGAG